MYTSLLSQNFNNPHTSTGKRKITTTSHQTRGRERKLVRLLNRFLGTRGTAAGEPECSEPGRTTPDLEPPKTGEKAHESTVRGKAGCGRVQCPKEGTENPIEPDRCKAHTRMTAHTTKGGGEQKRMHLETPSAKRRTVYVKESVCAAADVRAGLPGSLRLRQKRVIAGPRTLPGPAKLL